MWTDEEVAEETDGVAEGWRIQLQPVLDWEDRVNWQPVVIPVTTEYRAQIAARFARNFHQEMHYDDAPFYEHQLGEVNRNIYLIRNHEYLRLIPVASGAVEIRIVEGSPVLMWVWLHPFDRGRRHVWSGVWDELVRMYGDFYVQAPLSHTMKAWLTKRNVPNERIVTVG